MPITIKSDSTNASMVSIIDFYDKPIYAIEISASENFDPIFIRGIFQGLSKALGMGGTFCEFVVDFDAIDKVRVTGNISQAMQIIKNNNEVQIADKEFSVFSKKLFSDIDDNTNVQVILKNCQRHYDELENNDKSMTSTTALHEEKTQMPFFSQGRTSRQ